VQVESSPGFEDHAPRYVESVVSGLRAAIAGMRCPEHGMVPVLTLAFGTEDDATVAVVPRNCCSKLDELVADALRGSPIFRLMRPR
jgi:hypothetical protein